MRKTAKYNKAVAVLGDYWKGMTHLRLYAEMDARHFEWQGNEWRFLGVPAKPVTEHEFATVYVYGDTRTGAYEVADKCAAALGMIGGKVVSRRLFQAEQVLGTRWRVRIALSAIPDDESEDLPF